MKYKLAIIDSHPIQYRAPLFKRLAQHPQIDLCVYYYSNHGTVESLDPGFGIRFKWDVPLLDGYNYKFLNNHCISPLISKPWRFFNPSIIWELRKNQYDAVILYGYSLSTNWLVSFLSAFLKIPILFTGETTFLGVPRRIKRFFLKLFFYNINACLYIGTKSFEFYRYLKTPQRKLFFMPYSVDNDFFITRVGMIQNQRNQIKREIGILDNLPVILCVSKMIPRKGLQVLLKAFRKIDKRAALLFIGDGPLRVPLEDYVFKSQIKNVFFLGFKNQSELPRYYGIADIFALPSFFEPWGLVINEAMCAGLPIIATNKVAAAYDLIKEGENGHMFKVGNIEGLSNSLEDLILYPKKRRDMGLKSLEIISGWNYDICIKGIIDALEFVR